MYEVEFKKVLEKIGIDEDIWEGSRELYMQNETDGQNTSIDGYSIDTVDKRVYEILPQPIIPKSLNKQKAKELFIEVNSRANKLYVKELMPYVAQSFLTEYEPLIMEALSFDLIFLEYNFSEVIFRYVIHKYEL